MAWMVINTETCENMAVLAISSTLGPKLTIKVGLLKFLREPMATMVQKSSLDFA